MNLLKNDPRIVFYRKIIFILLGCFYVVLSLLIWRREDVWGFRFILVYFLVLYIAFFQGERFSQHVYQNSKLNYWKKYLVMAIFGGNLPSFTHGAQVDEKAGEKKWQYSSLGPGIITVDRDHALVIEDIDQQTYKIITNDSVLIKNYERLIEIVSLNDQYLFMDAMVYTKDRIPLIVRGITVHYRLSMTDTESKAIRAKNASLPARVESAVSRNIYNRAVRDGEIIDWTRTMQDIVLKSYREVVEELSFEEVVKPGKDDDFRMSSLPRITKDLGEYANHFGTRIIWMNFNNIEIQHFEGLQPPISPWLQKAKIKEAETTAIASENLLLANEKLVDEFRARTLTRFIDGCSRFNLAKDPVGEILQLFFDQIPNDNL